MFRLAKINFHTRLTVKRRIVFIPLLLLIFYNQPTLSEVYEPKVSINGSGLKIPRIVSLKNSLTYMRSGPGKKYPIIYEIKKKGYPIKIVAEFNNWRKINTSHNLTGWIHTQMLSSFRTALIVKETLLKKTPSDSGARFTTSSRLRDSSGLSSLIF